MSESVVARLEHCRQLRYCAGGCRSWFRRHGFDWNDFLKNGIAVEKLEGTGDSMAKKLAEQARGRK